MAVEIREEGRLLIAEVHGLMLKSEFDHCVQLAKQAIAKHGKICILVLLEGVTGWQRGANWGDISFAMEYDAEVEKIAIVGDERWKDEAFAFTAKPFRTTAIEFFPVAEAAAARRWVAS